MTQPPPPPQPPSQAYIPPPAPPRSSRLPAFLGYWFIYTVMVLMPVFLFVYAVSVWVPEVIPIYRDFKTSLPSLTEWLIDQSHSINTIPFWVETILAAGLLSLVLAAVTALMPRGFLRAAIAMLSMLFILIFTVAEALVLNFAIWDPLVHLIRSVSP